VDAVGLHAVERHAIAARQGGRALSGATGQGEIQGQGGMSCSEMAARLLPETENGVAGTGSPPPCDVVRCGVAPGAFEGEGAVAQVTNTARRPGCAG